MSRVFVDTSAYYAFLDRTDTSHTSAQSIFPKLLSDGSDLFTTNFVLAETHALLLNRIGRDAAMRFLDTFFQSTMILIRVTEADETTAREILRASSDKEYSYTDATSFAVMDRLHIKEALTYDHHFAQQGYSIVN
jgi:predicted nucleic acid-binding protein